MRKKETLTYRKYNHRTGQYDRKRYKVDSPEELNLEWIWNLIIVIAVIALVACCNLKV